MITYTCESVGMHGNCGDGCPLFADGLCEIPFEIDNIELYPDEYDEIIESYNAVARAKKERDMQIEQLQQRKPNFKISKAFVCNMLVDYYQNKDNSLKNPMKMFIDNDAFDEEIINGITDKLNKVSNYERFAFDLLLNGLEKHIIPSFKNHYGFFGEILSDMHTNSSLSTLKELQNNFYEADLNMNFFNNLGYTVDSIFLAIDSDGLSRVQLRILKHEDYDITTKIKIAEISGDNSFLPQQLQDMFIF